MAPNLPLPFPASPRPSPHDGLVERDGELLYAIEHSERLAPFLMTIVGSSDHWLFLSSTGALTAGRVDAERALFPYETEDRLHRAAGQVGPFTLLRCRDAAGQDALWEPFTGRLPEQAHRNLYKSPLGTRVVFEETHAGLGLTFRYEWGLSDELGFVRRATLEAHASHAPSEVGVLDGLRYLMPFGVGTRLQQGASCLADAYKHSELDADAGLGIFSLTAHIVDRAEPAECHRATVAWERGLPDPVHLLGLEQIESFRQGLPLEPEELLTGRPGNYLLAATLPLAPGAHHTWHVVADVARTQPQVVALREALTEAPDALVARVDESVASGRRALAALIERADGAQCGNDAMVTARHAANVLFNGMRGGIFAEQRVPREDLRSFLHTRNRAVAEAHADFVDALPAEVQRDDLLEAAADRGDPSLWRLCAEYLPLAFSRRHGDPSRPWNRFSIRVRHPDGSLRLDYEGNWRDIFQNWEALAVSFPAFIEATIAVFVNASTADGFNPYRLTRAGLDWEVPDDGDDWAHIGYWGDHQIIYLLKLLEASADHHPGRLELLLAKRAFAYADVPYRLRPYAELVVEPHHTIDYDHAAAAASEARVASLGGDGRLVTGTDGRILHVTLAEKLLVPALAKLSNLVVDGGIWMNTQRPEWNDANNALVGYGVSMVTHHYLHRYARFAAALFARLDGEPLGLSAEVATWLDRVTDVLARSLPLLAAPRVDDVERRVLLDALGAAFSDYREAVYARGLSAPVTRPATAVAALFEHALTWLEHGVAATRRDDGLYHAYSLVDLSEPGRARLGALAPMLEGQVAVLSTDVLTPEDAVDLVDTLFAGPLYRKDQHSFLLYPDRRLPRFLERNVIPPERVEPSPLLRALLESSAATPPGERPLVVRDARGDVRFDSDLRSPRDLTAALDALAGDPALGELVRAGRVEVRDAWEAVFHHRSFTGRSGTMYGYEGLGSIYWHMVSKLLLAVQESVFRAADAGAAPAALRALAERYYRVRAGLGFNKSALEYGAFPTDAYSHTPKGGGARQPGMTGQVKEDILARRGELGVRVCGGRLTFQPLLLRRAELLERPARFAYRDVSGRERTLDLPADSLAFTVCQLPVVYRLAEGPPSLTVTWASRERRELPGRRLDPETSALLFERRGALDRLDVGLARDELLAD